MSTTRRLAASLFALGLVGAPAAHAADPMLGEGFTVSLGSFAMDTSTVFRVDGTLGNGDEVDLEQDLGLSDSSRFRVDMTWRFAEKHKLRALWFNNDRTATRTLAQDITVGDTTYLAGSTVSTIMDTDVLELAYEYAFWREDDWEVTGSAGLHVLMFAFDIDGAVDSAPEADATGPLPVVGARGLWKVGSAWYLEAQAQFFGIEFGGIKGRLDDYKASATYLFGERYGVGLGWNEFTMRISANETDFDGVFQWKYGGPMVFLSASF